MDVVCISTSLLCSSTALAIISNDEVVRQQALRIGILQALVVYRSDNAIHWINRYPVDSLSHFVDNYPPDSYLSDGERYPPFALLGPGD